MFIRTITKPYSKPSEFKTESIPKFKYYLPIYTYIYISQPVFSFNRSLEIIIMTQTKNVWKFSPFRHNTKLLKSMKIQVVAHSNSQSGRLLVHFPRNDWPGIESWRQGSKIKLVIVYQNTLCHNSEEEPQNYYTIIWQNRCESA